MIQQKGLMKVKKVVNDVFDCLDKKISKKKSFMVNNNLYDDVRRFK